MNTHITLVISAMNKKALKSALLLACKAIDEDDTMLFIHDDYHMSYEMFDNETLKTFAAMVNPSFSIKFTAEP